MSRQNCISVILHNPAEVGVRANGGVPGMNTSELHIDFDISSGVTIILSVEAIESLSRSLAEMIEAGGHCCGKRSVRALPFPSVP